MKARIWTCISSSRTWLTVPSPRWFCWIGSDGAAHPASKRTTRCARATIPIPNVAGSHSSSNPRSLPVPEQARTLTNRSSFVRVTCAFGQIDHSHTMRRMRCNPSYDANGYSYADRYGTHRQDTDLTRLLAVYTGTFHSRANHLSWCHFTLPGGTAASARLACTRFRNIDFFRHLNLIRRLGASPHIVTQVPTAANVRMAVVGWVQ